MKRTKILFAVLSFLFVCLLFVNFIFVRKMEVPQADLHPEVQSCIGLKVDNQWLSDPFDSKALAVVDVHHTGMLTITDAPNLGKGPFTPVAFKIFIKKNSSFKAEPVKEYINKIIFEADLKTVLKYCNPGDKIILEVSEAGKYDPDFQNISVVDNC